MFTQPEIKLKQNTETV